MVANVFAGVAALAAAIAFANSARAAPVWAGGPCTTETHWIGIPTGTNPEFTEAASCPGSSGLGSGFNVGGSPGSGSFLFLIPNWVDDLAMKKIWIMVTTVVDPNQTGLSIDVINAVDNDPTAQVDIQEHLRSIEQVAGGWNVIEEWWITPNPDWEEISIVSGSTQQPFPITDIWIHTISMDMPEPGTMAIFGFGLAGLAWMRRRRSAI
jgi:hypothetical protein